MERRGLRCQCIRCREIRKQSLGREDLRLECLVYQAGAAQEVFLSFVTLDDKLAGFLRLSLPDSEKSAQIGTDLGLADLDGAAIIREVHVYGQSLAVGLKEPGVAQHSGLGTRLIRRAEFIAREQGFGRLVVIAAVGTRRYYLRRGFKRGALYLVKDLI